MKIHGTAKGGALSKKDFGVAFGGGGAAITELWAENGTGQNEGFGTGITILAQRFQTGQVLMGKTITRFDVSLRKEGSPTGDITGRIINSSNTQKLNMGTLDAATLTTSYVTHTFENLDGYVLADGDRLAIYFVGDDSNKPDWSMNTSSEANTNGSYYKDGSWTERTRDATMAVYGY